MTDEKKAKQNSEAEAAKECPESTTVAKKVIERIGEIGIENVKWTEAIVRDHTVTLLGRNRLTKIVKDENGNDRIVRLKSHEAEILNLNQAIEEMRRLISDFHSSALGSGKYVGTSSALMNKFILLPLGEEMKRLEKMREDVNAAAAARAEKR